MGELGDSTEQEGEIGPELIEGTWIFNCDPKRTIRLSCFEDLSLAFSLVRESIMPSPIALESPLSQGWWCLLLSKGTLVSLTGFGGFLSEKKGLPMEEKGLVSSMEVGLMAAGSVSVNPFEEKPTKSLGEGKRDEDAILLYFPVGDWRLCLLLLTALDLFFSIRNQDWTLNWFQ